MGNLTAMVGKIYLTGDRSMSSEVQKEEKKGKKKNVKKIKPENSDLFIISDDEEDKGKSDLIEISESDQYEENKIREIRLQEKKKNEQKSRKSDLFMISEDEDQEETK